jgi:hypothetical protein
LSPARHGATCIAGHVLFSGDMNISSGREGGKIGKKGMGVGTKTSTLILDELSEVGNDVDLWQMQEIGEQHWTSSKLP